MGEVSKFASFLQAFNFIDEGVLVAWRDTKIVYGNSAAQRLLDASADDLVGRELPDVVDLIDPSQWAAARAAVRNGGSWFAESECKTKDAKRRWIEWSLKSTVFDEEVGPCLIAVFRDVSERKRAESAIRASEERFRHVVESPLAGIAVLDQEQRFVYVNRRLAAIFGDAVDRMGHVGVLNYIAPPDRGTVAAMIAERCSEPGVAGRVQAAGVGGESVLELSATTYVDALGQIRTVLHCLDVTERRRAVVAFRESESALRSLLNATHDIAVLLDRSGEILAANKRFRVKYGVDAADTLGRDILEFVSGEIGQTRTRRFLEVVFKQHSVNFTDEESGRYLEHTAFPVFDERGQVARVAWFARDDTERIAAERTLVNSERRFRGMAENSPVGIGLIENSQLMFCNRAAEDITGYTFEEMKQFTGLRMIDPADHERLIDMIIEAQATGAVPRDVEFNIIRKDGRKRYVRVQYVKISEKDEFIDRMLVVDDLTDRKRAEEALRESEQRYRSLVEMSPDSITVQSGGKYLFVNPAAARMMGFDSPAELIGGPVLDIIHPSSHQAAKDRVAAAMLTGEPSPLTELRGVRRDGTTFQVESMGIRIDFQNEPALLVLSRDVSESRRVEAALRESEREKALVLSTVPDAIVYLDTDLRVIWANEAAMGSASFGKDDVKGKRFDHVWPQHDIDNDLEPVKLALATGRRQEVEIVTNDGKRTAIAKANPVCDGDGRVAGVVIMVRDVTRERQAEVAKRLHEQQMIRADKMITLGHLVSGVAHEINNPNQFIMSNVVPLRRIIMDGLPILEKYFAEHGDFLVGGREFSVRRTQVDSMFENIVEGSKRIAAIVDDLREYAGGGVPTKTDRVDINRVVRSAISLLGNMLKKATSDLVVDFAENLPPVDGRSQRLEQVVINLLQNACHAVEGDRSEIAVSTRFVPETDTVVIEVRDAGVGIDPEDLPHVTDPFFTTKRQSGGIGLGLPISSQIIAEHGGVLDFASTSGQGTTATVRLPVAPADVDQGAS